MGNLENFDASTVEPATGFDIIPDGKYSAIIIDSEMKDTKAGTGQYLQLVFEIIGEKFKGRRLWSRLNLVNKNETAVKIAQAELSAICRAVGIMTPRDSSTLHNIPLIIDVGQEKNNQNDTMQNRIFGYLPPSGAVHVSTVAAQIVQAVKVEKPPWDRK
jgi:hypothetical protein